MASTWLPCGARSRSAAHTMLASLCILSVAAIAYFVCGFAVQGFTGQPTHIVTAGGERWDWLGAGPFFFRRFDLNGSPASLAAGFSMLCVGLAALVPLGAAAERIEAGLLRTLGDACGRWILEAHALDDHRRCPRA